MPALAKLLALRQPDVAADAAGALRAFASAGRTEATLVLGAITRLGRTSAEARRIVADLEATARAARARKPARAPAATPIDQLPPRAPRVGDDELRAMPALTKATCRAADRVKIASVSWSPPRCKELLAALHFPNAVSISVWILDGQPLGEFLRGAAALPCLQRLRLRGLDAVPDEVALLRRLYDLELEGRGGMGLPAITPELAALRELEGLTIRESHADDLPDELCELRSLRRLRLTMFKLKGLPARLARLDQLEEVALDVAGASTWTARSVGWCASRACETCGSATTPRPPASGSSRAPGSAPGRGLAAGCGRSGKLGPRGVPCARRSSRRSSSR